LNLGSTLDTPPRDREAAPRELAGRMATSREKLAATAQLPSVERTGGVDAAREGDSAARQARQAEETRRAQLRVLLPGPDAVRSWRARLLGADWGPQRGSLAGGGAPP